MVSSSEDPETGTPRATWERAGSPGKTGGAVENGRQEFEEMWAEPR